ncbi:LacI family DNA-binding transcriptional regulator [Demequina salsinemoris]|uniref:LacI family DNA-binding transcriptional regulator n=1 Tax=Demequina salsinemoris TaxID=577470 RepID=UPI000783E089|nr:LacI family DNA-binding transcriptional regulator [Demequina salsinemoris]
MAPTPNGGRKPTIRDVATVAGVSHGTVSRVLNGGRWVSPEAREAVEQAIAKTGYTVNRHAQALATGRANSIAFLLTEPQHLLFADPTFSILLRGAAESTAGRGATLVLLVAGNDAERANVAEYVRAGHVDGVLLISSHEADPMLETLVTASIPTVACGIPLGFRGEIPHVSVDEAGSARTMAKYLVRQGHKRIAMITGPHDTPGGRYRLEGFADALGDQFDPALVEEGDYSEESGAAAMRRILDRASDVDAVFAASDLMAAGALVTLRRAGLRVPEDVAVAGFDDSGLAERLDPPLTTMRQPWEQISEEMVTLLQQVVAGGMRKSITLPAELIVRASA